MVALKPYPIMKPQTKRAPHQKGVLAAAFLIALLPLITLPLAAATPEEDPAVAARKALEAVTAIAQTTTNTEAELRQTQREMERLRRELEQRMAQNSEAITASMRVIETSLGQMNDRQKVHIGAVESSNRAILTVAGVFAAVGIIGLIFILVILSRALGRFSEIAVATAPRPQLLGAGQAQGSGMLGNGENLQRGSSAEESSARFQGAIDQLQKRIMELEQSVQTTPASSGHQGRNGNKTILTTSTVTANIEPLMPEDNVESAADENSPASRASVLVGKGQALLNLDSVEPAMQCFNEALALEPNNAEALVKRGMAFEKMQDWERALECYDNAIAADSSLTVAYLYRGGVCNRLQRYREALESYEQALRTEKSSRAS
jgi:tetratricopeptide (TPR) repeat protein